MGQGVYLADLDTIARRAIVRRRAWRVFQLFCEYPTAGRYPEAAESAYPDRRLSRPQVIVVGRLPSSIATSRASLATPQHPIPVTHRALCHQGGVRRARRPVFAHYGAACGDGWQFLPSPFIVGCPCRAGLGRLLPLVSWRAL